MLLSWRSFLLRCLRGKAGSGCRTLSAMLRELCGVEKSIQERRFKKGSALL